MFVTRFSSYECFPIVASEESSLLTRHSSISSYRHCAGGGDLPCGRLQRLLREQRLAVGLAGQPETHREGVAFSHLGKKLQAVHARHADI